MPPRKRKPPLEIRQDTDPELDAQLAENVPDAFAPGYEGYLLRIAGAPWAEVAEKIGSSSASGAMQAVSGYLQKAAAAQSTQHMQEVLQIQLGRYDAMLAQWWTPGTTGRDKDAALVVLRVLERIDRLHRFADSDIVVAKETLVIAADPAEYVRQLQGVVEERRVTKSIGPTGT